MLTIAWNHNGFHVVTALPNGHKFKAGHYLYNRNTGKNQKSKIGWRDRELAGLEN
jgi:hypothetical protein